jgi:hypothetical protein
MVTVTVMRVVGMAIVRGLRALRAVVLVRVMGNAVLAHVSCVKMRRSVMWIVGRRVLKVALLATRVTVVSKLRTFCHPAALWKELLCISMSTARIGPAYSLE